ncbi:MAG TPA: hypothetical protein VEI27_02225 [Dehalococcoidales bacterium]|nr:hypothetical protein [Dehalococcoidales bacterium]
MKRQRNLITTLVLAITLVVLVISSGCKPKNTGFAIYLTANNIPPAQLPVATEIKPAAQPLISIKDIISYDAQTHEIKLTTRGFKAVSQLGVPTDGTSFVVCVDGKPIYGGAFWTPVSSASFSGLIIEKPLITEGAPVIRIEKGYPTAAFFRGTDSRSDPAIMASLEKSGKLINAAK